MTRLSRPRMILAAIAVAAIAATAGCAQQATSVANPVAAPVVLARVPAATVPHAHNSKAHATQGQKKPRHTPSPSPTRTSPTTSTPGPTTPAPTTPGPTSPGPGPTTPPPPPPAGTCSTSSQSGECGPYTDPQIEGLGSGNQNNIQVGNNIYSPISGASSTLYASSPADWHVIANMPAGNTGVVSYPSVGVDFHLQNSSGSWYEQPLTHFHTMVSSFSENMHTTSGTSAWAAYDIWLNGGNNEIMIQHDFANNGPCDNAAEASFGGSNGVPVQTWHLCQFGSEQVWKLGTNDSHKVNEQSGSVDILAMLTWMENHGDLPKNSTIGLLGYGWEICSTGGANENFQVNSFTITTS